MRGRTHRLGQLAVVGAGLAEAAIARAQGDPFESSPSKTPPAPTAPTGSGPTPSPTLSLPLPPLDPKCAHITGAVCKQQNTMILGTAGAYVAVCVLLAVLLRGFWNRRGMKPGVAFVVPMLLAASGAGTLAGLDPARGADAICCLASGVFKAEILLQDSAIGRAFLLGALPAIVLYVLIAFVVGLTKK